MKTYWRLPRGVDELLPPAAWRLELLRRRVLDLFVSWGFEYVEPPIIEYLEALLVGSGEDLDLQTLKVVDQVTGRQLGVRADMTSQAVRIDAHSLVTDDVQRLCYAGTVVFANPEIAHTSRVPLKAGAEIFGAASVEADAEVVRLMFETVSTAGIEQPVLLLGHMGIYRGLVQALIDAGDLDAAQEHELFACLQRKSQSDIRDRLPASPLGDMLEKLPMLMGGVESLAQVQRSLSRAPEPVQQALAELQELIGLIQATGGDFSVRLDVSELSGYGYHNGAVFAVYHPQHGSALAQGGRYDGVGDAFGRSRPATGFDVNLKTLLQPNGQLDDVIFATYAGLAARQAQQEAVAGLRTRGERVRCALSANEQPPDSCRRVLAEIDGLWQVEGTRDGT